MKQFSRTLEKFNILSPVSLFGSDVNHTLSPTLTHHTVYGSSAADRDVGRELHAVLNVTLSNDHIRKRPTEDQDQDST